MKIIAILCCTSILFSSSILHSSSSSASSSNAEQLAEQVDLPPIPVTSKEIAQNMLLVRTQRIQALLHTSPAKNELQAIHQAYCATWHKENESWQIEAQLQALKKSNANDATIKAKELELQQADNAANNENTKHANLQDHIRDLKNPDKTWSLLCLEQRQKNATRAQALILASEKHELEQREKNMTAQLAQLAAHNRFQSIHIQSLHAQLKQLQKPEAQDMQIEGLPAAPGGVQLQRKLKRRNSH